MIKDIKLTINYLWMVFLSTWKTKEWTSIKRSILYLLGTILILDCLFILLLLGKIPDFSKYLINDLSSDVITDLTKLAFGLLFLVFIYPYFFLREAARIHNDQHEVITYFQSEELKMMVENGGHIYLDKDSRDIIPCLVIDVVNNEKRKIVELEAHLRPIDQWTENMLGSWNVSHNYSVKDNLMEWEDGSYKIDLTPGFPETKLKLASLNCMSRDFKFMSKGGYSIKPFQQNAIYKINVFFKAKLEEDPDYRYYNYSVAFVCSPENSILDYLPEAANSPNLPAGLKAFFSPKR